MQITAVIQHEPRLLIQEAWASRALQYLDTGEKTQGGRGPRGAVCL